MTQVKWTLLHGGYCTHPEKIVLPTGTWKPRIFPALFSLIEHPKEGPILFDTGYSSHFLTETRRFPYRLIRLITPVTFHEHEGAIQQVRQAGYSPEEVRYIILSHFHTDHIAGTRDFPQSIFICSRAAWEAVRGKKGWAAVRRGTVPRLFPEDFAERLRFIEDTPKCETFSPFATGHDLIGDGSLISVDLPGHADGQIGLFLNTEQDEVIFLAADSCWLSEAYQKRLLPHPISNLLTADPEAYKDSLSQVYQLSQEHPNIRIVPSHCLDTWQAILEARGE